MNNLQKLILQRMERIKVCVNEFGSGGNEAGIIIMSSLSDLSKEEKIALTRESGLHELAFIQKIDDSNYHAEFYNDNQEVFVCGHLSLAISCLLNKSDDSITLHTAGDRETKLMSVDGCPAIIMPKSSPDSVYVSRTSENRYYDLNQNKEIVLVTPEQLREVEITESLRGRAVLFAAEIKPGEYHTRFFRNGKEDPFHLSGLVPLELILSPKGSVSFISSNGGRADITPFGDSDLILSGSYIELPKQINIRSRL